MTIVIDGYNLLKQIFPGIKENLSRQKEIFIQELAFYKNKKPEIKEIVVVFDGGPLLHATREIHHGIIVVYSGLRSSADNWIIHFVDRNIPKQILVVTLDREIKSACEKMGADSFNVYDFYQIIQRNLLEEAEEPLKKQNTGFTKFDRIDFDDPKKNIDTRALDLLMQEASIRTPKEEDKEQDYLTKRQGKSYTPSKNEKKMKKKLKKIL